jgi:hypothetical protein
MLKFQSSMRSPIDGGKYEPVHTDVDSEYRSSDGESNGNNAKDPLLNEDAEQLLGRTRSSKDSNNPFHVLRETGTFSSVVNLTNSIIGSGILGLPYAFAASGWYLGYALITLAALLTLFSLYLLSVCATKVEHPSSFYKVTNASIPRATFLVDASVASMCFGVAVSYLIVIGGLMPDVNV